MVANVICAVNDPNSSTVGTLGSSFARMPQKQCRHKLPCPSWLELSPAACCAAACYRHRCTRGSDTPYNSTSCTGTNKPAPHLHSPRAIASSWELRGTRPQHVTAAKSCRNSPRCHTSCAQACNANTAPLRYSPSWITWL